MNTTAYADFITRADAAREQAEELRTMLIDLRDERLPGSSIYLALDRAQEHATQAINSIQAASDIAQGAPRERPR